MNTIVAFRDAQKLAPGSGTAAAVGRDRRAACLHAASTVLEGEGRRVEGGCPACCLSDPFHVSSNDGLRRRQERGRTHGVKGDPGAQRKAKVDLRRPGEGTVAPSARPLF